MNRSKSLPYFATASLLLIVFVVSACGTASTPAPTAMVATEAPAQAPTQAAGQHQHAAVGVENLRPPVGVLDGLAEAHRAVVGQDDDVSVAEDGYVRRHQHLLAEVRGDELEGEGDLVEDDGGDGNHQQEKGDWKQQDFEVIPAIEKQDSSGDGSQDGKAGQKEF